MIRRTLHILHHARVSIVTCFGPLVAQLRLAVHGAKVDPGARRSIGVNVRISNATFVAMHEVVISDDVRIGGGDCIYDTDYRSVELFEQLSDSLHVVAPPDTLAVAILALPTT